MKSRAPNQLQQIADALAAADDEALLSALSEVDSDGVLRVWARFQTVDGVFFRRVLAYALAKAASTQTRYLWAPIADFVGASDVDEATLANLLSALQPYDEYDDILEAVLGPYFGAFALRCANAGRVALGGLCELLADLSERSALTNLLTKAQVAALQRPLRHAVDIAIPESDTAMAGLQRSEFPDALVDRRERLGVEEATLSTAGTIDAAVFEAIRNLLARVRSEYALRRQAADANGLIEEISLDGSDATQGRLPVDTLEKLVHHWKTAIREGVAALSANQVPSMTTYVLAPATGSFILRFLVQAHELEVVSQSFEEIARVTENPEELVAATSLTIEAKNQIVQFLDVLAQRKLNATIGLIDARMIEKPRRRVLSERIAPILKRFRELPTENRTRHEISGVLEGASHRQGTFEIQTDTIGTIKGDVPAAKRSVLLHKVIGDRYQFVLDEVITGGFPGEEKTQWILISISGTELQETQEVEPSRPEPTELTTDDVPQQDALEPIVAIVKLVAEGQELHPKKLGMPNTSSSRRHINYRRQAARVLGLLATDGTLTPAGRTLAQLPDSRVLDFLSVRFEVSVVGRLWKRKAKVQDVHDLDPNSASSFLRAYGLSESMAERRGRTLRRWLVAFQSLRKHS